MHAASPAFSPALLTVDLGALADNYRFFQDKAAQGCAVAGIVKANAYGLGAEPVVRTLHGLRCRFFFVATPDEGVQVRAALQDPTSIVAVLGGVYPGAEKDYAAHALAPVLNALEEIGRWKKACPGAPALLHFDTGMNRLGLGAQDAERLWREPEHLEGLNLCCVMSHFACADDPAHPLTGLQAARFARIAAHFPKIAKSLCNSAGVFHDPSFHYDLLRPGIGLYGGLPIKGRANPLRPVVRLQARVLQTRGVEEGASAGYGASYRFPPGGRAATVALGYADGFLRALSNRGRLWWKGQPLPIAGRVSMDLVILDLSGLEGEGPEPGDWVEVIGPSQDIDALATDAGTISYEILTGLGRRYARRYEGP